MPGEVYTYTKDGYTLTIMEITNSESDIGDIEGVIFSKSYIQS